MARVVAIAGALVLLGAAAWRLGSEAPPHARRTRRAEPPPQKHARLASEAGEIAAEAPPSIAEEAPPSPAARGWEMYERTVRLHERMDASWDGLSALDRTAVVAESVRLLLSDAPDPVREEAAGFLGRHASAADLDRVQAAALEGSELAVEVLVEVFKRERHEPILETLRTLARGEPGPASARALEVLIDEDGALAAEAWIRHLEAELPSPDGARRLHENLAAHLDPGRIERLDALARDTRDADLAMILDAAWRSERRHAAREACWREWEAGRGEAADDLLRLRDPRIGPALLTALRGGGPLSAERAHELLGEHTGAGISALRLRVGIEVPDEASRWRRVASEWEAWWTREGEAFASRNPYAR
ncbi:MAG: hypothetical protein HYY17_03275 [Planctomycetes bacterium]|nr:hypothetical protein [Planctomycetota bacterium]